MMQPGAGGKAAPPRPVDVLNGSAAQYYDPASPDLLDRWAGVNDWVKAQADAGLSPHGKVTVTPVGPQIRGLDAAGRNFDGVNFASQDCLGLGSHPRVVAAAVAAAQSSGVHAGGSAALMGLSTRSIALEQRLARFLRCADTTLVPGGGGRVVQALLRPGDHLVTGDDTAPPASLATLHRGPLTAAAVSATLAAIRAAAPDAGILLVAEALSPRSSDSPDLTALCDLARQHRATLLVDVTQDLGALGPTGRGVIEEQGLLGEIDIVTGGFAMTFAGNGGFVAGRHPALKTALRLDSGGHSACCALSPVQTASLHAAIDIADSIEGQDRRLRLMANVLALRSALVAQGFAPPGRPGPVVPVPLGDAATARRMTAAVLARGGIVNLVDGPGGWHWPLLVMADHSAEDVARFAAIAALARAGLPDVISTAAEPGSSG